MGLGVLNKMMIKPRVQILGLPLDTFTFDRHPNTNYINSQILACKKSGSNFNRRSYFQFNTGNEQKNTLRLFAYSDGTSIYVQTPQTLTLYLVDYFDINEITWANQDNLIKNRVELSTKSLSGTYLPTDIIDFTFNKNVTGYVFLELQQISGSNKNFHVNSENHPDIEYSPQLLMIP